MPTKIFVKGKRLFNEKTNEFIDVKDTTLTIEHSLVSISKWESKWHVSFLSTKDKTDEQVIDYIKCMTITQNVDPNIFSCFTNENFAEVIKYIEDPMTATRINDPNKAPSNKVITTEQIYYWMIKFGIPFECQKWHINRLIQLIRVCEFYETPKQQMSQNEILRQNSDLNAQRLAAARKLKRK